MSDLLKIFKRAIANLSHVGLAIPDVRGKLFLTFCLLPFHSSDFSISALHFCFIEEESAVLPQLPHLAVDWLHKLHYLGAGHGAGYRLRAQHIYLVKILLQSERIQGLRQNYIRRNLIPTLTTDIDILQIMPAAC